MKRNHLLSPSFRMPGLIVALLAALLAGLLTLSACAGGATAPGTLVDYRRSGGFAGVDDHLVVQVDGQVNLTTKAGSQTFNLSPEQLKALETSLESAGFDALQKSYLPERQGADRFDYQVAYAGKSVHTMDGSVPSQLAPVIDQLNLLVDAQGQGAP